MLDIHTHKGAPQPEAVVALRGEQELLPGQLYSIGLHPWDTGTNTAGNDLDHTTGDTGTNTAGNTGEENLSLLRSQIERVAESPQVVAIGEAGIDTLRGAPMFRQLQEFKWQFELSERLRKPMVIHAVKADDIICGLRRDLSPTLPWAIHGYRGKPSAASQLIKAGCYISFGEKFNPETLKSIPDNRILAETDESPLPIQDIIRRLSEVKGYDLTPIIKANSDKFCNFGG